MTFLNDCSSVRRWQSETRYYTAEVVQDLFGEWALLCSWGGLGGRRGSYRFSYMPSYQAAVAAIERLDKRRQQRGYQLR